MVAQRLDGSGLSKTIRAEIAEEVKDWTSKGNSAPGLAAVLLGDNPASQVYVRNKQKACEQAGIQSWLHHLPSTTNESELLALIAQLNRDSSVSGILVQLPLPKHIDEKKVIQSIDPIKDVDAFHPENVGLLATGHPRFLPCTPFGVQQLLARNGIETAGKEIAIVGRSNIVGKPLALMMMQKRSSTFPEAGDASVTVLHSKSTNLGTLTRQADILIAALGAPKFITGSMVKPGAVVVDVGIHNIDGKIVGDVDTDSVAEVASWLSPVPGGVGPLTITMLLQNTLRAGRMQSQRH
jgi:methylenetetrahydrofolate dehydrogenase (NADP+) / methenyltetrahydrofolate cyclohydrolase